MKEIRLTALAALVSAACVVIPSTENGDAGASGRRGDGGAALDGGGASVLDAGALGVFALPNAPAPVDDDPTACTGILPHPELAPVPDRPCTEERPDGTTRWRYDPSGRLVFEALHSDGYDRTYESAEDGGTRTEIRTENGHLASLDVTRLSEGNPLEADHFQATDGGMLQLAGHTTWFYDASGRQQFAISQSTKSWTVVERDLYDAKGRLYFVDQTGYWPGTNALGPHHWTFKSWFAGGSLAQQVDSCGPAPGTGPEDHMDCPKSEQRWDACGNLVYSAMETAVLRQSIYTDWSWDRHGIPLTRHDHWIGTIDGFSALETYQRDSLGRVASGTIVNTNPPSYPAPPAVQQQATYAYDEAGHTTERLVDGQSNFSARFDGTGRLLERTWNGNLVGRWTYDGCGR